MTEEEHQEEERARYEYEQQCAFYDWLSTFEFGQRALDRMQKSSHPDEQKAAEWFERHLQKAWETRPLVFDTSSLT